MIAFHFTIINAQVADNAPKLRMSLQQIVPSDVDTGKFVRTNDIQFWNPKETAIIICDMWNQHWCKGATERVAEMAPFMNNVVSIAREKGILIVHAPSDVWIIIRTIRRGNWAKI